MTMTVAPPAVQPSLGQIALIVGDNDDDDNDNGDDDDDDDEDRTPSM